MSSTNYVALSLGYPMTPSDAFAIDPGATYTLSYLVNAVGATVEVKIGHAEAPYTPLYSTTDLPGTAGPQTFTHQISSSVGDPGAGLVFNVTLVYYSDVCFDDVTLVKN